MSEETTRLIPTTLGPDGVPVAKTITSSTGNRVRAQCKALPHTVVPVVFVPGIMGSNLCNKHTGESVWNVSSKGSLALQWAFRQASTRQKKLRYTECEVDERGNFPGPSATVPDADAAEKRGWGGPSKFSYGEFLRWLDDRLNSDLCGSSAPGVDQSPWKEYEGKGAYDDNWNPEKPFQAITEKESSHAWNNFYCPVHAVGYNWLQSNGASGKDRLAKRIQEITDYWDNLEVDGRKPFSCAKVILVSHSMGGLVARAAVHEAYGGASKKVLGIVHGELPANGAAAAYHHCRSGYSGMPSVVLGRNAAQVTAVFANSPGAMELLPNQQYPANWLRAKLGEHVAFSLPENASDPYTVLYLDKTRWWRLVDPSLIDPADHYKRLKLDPWLKGYVPNLRSTRKFHYTLKTYYHSQTYVNYGSDTTDYPAWDELDWESSSKPGDFKVPKDLRDYALYSGSDPVTLNIIPYGGITFEIAGPGSQPGDGTVPACSGEAPNLQGGGSVKQSFRLDGFEHQGAFNNERVRETTLYSICKLLQEADVL